MRLFTAVVPAVSAVESLRAALADAGGEEGLRWTPAGQWHVTLGFYGTVDPADRVPWLAGRLTGRPAPELRLAGAGTFPGVLWVGAVGDGLGSLADAAGAGEDERPYRPHLTVAKGRDCPARRQWFDRLEGYEGPCWTATEVVLFGSENTGTGARYTPIERFPLGAGSS